MNALVRTARGDGRLRRAPAALLVLVLGGCGGSSGFQDIDQFMAEVQARPKGRIAPLPEFQPYEAFAYSAAGQRSPFEPPVQVQPRRASESLVPPPDPNRVKQYLEQFSIGQLAMKGILADDDEFYALVEDAEGGVHRVREGDYLGTDNGQIDRITETEIELTEVVSDGAGGWLERPRTLTLATVDQ